MIAFASVSGICAMPPRNIPSNVSSSAGTLTAGREGANAGTSVSRGISAIAATMVRPIPSSR